MKLRPLFILMHRYVGLSIAVFLFIAGATGGLLAFYHELDSWVNPSFYHSDHATSSRGTPLDPFELRDQLERETDGLIFNLVPLEVDAGESAVFFATPKPSAQQDQVVAERVDNQYFVDPVTGEILGSRFWGDITQGTKNLMPFLYRLHYRLALGQTGSLLFGIVALLWTIDCFVGAYLTFPPRRTSTAADSKSWLTRWIPSWFVRTGSLFKLTFTWHRASGLWVWALLFVFAWSAVALNLNQVYRPIMKATVGMNDHGYTTLTKLETPQLRPTTDWREAHEVGNRLLRHQASERGIEVISPTRLIWQPTFGLFYLQAKTSADVGEHGRTTMYFDAENERVAHFGAPTGERLGNTITTWLYALHFAAVGGTPYRILVAATGGLVAVLSLSGVYVWWKKRRARVAIAQAASSPRRTEQRRAKSTAA